MIEQALQGQRKPTEQKKYVILVVGKQGVGKSSFVKSLAPQSMRETIFKQSIVNNQTLNPLLTLIDPTYNIIPEEQGKMNLYTMDTPGIDSIFSVNLVLEQIDRIILDQKCSIIGIAYVVDLEQRQIGEDQQKNDIWLYGQLFKRLKVRRSAKFALQFMVFTKFDLYYEQQETNQQRFVFWKNYLQKNNMPELWERQIKWMSQPKYDKQQFEECITSEIGKKIYKQQTQAIRQFIKENWNRKVTYEDFGKDYDQFIQNYRKQLLIKIQENPQISKDWIVQTKIQIQLSVRNRVSDKDRRLGIAASIVGAIGTVSGVARIVVSIITIATATAITGGLIWIPISIGGIGVAISAIKFGINKMITNDYNYALKKSKNLSPHDIQVWRKLNEELNKKRQEICITEIFNCLKCEKQCLQLRQSNLIKEAYVLVKNQRLPFTEKIGLKDMRVIKLEFVIPCPKLQDFVEILGSCSIKTYNQL